MFGLGKKKLDDRMRGMISIELAMFMRWMEVNHRMLRVDQTKDVARRLLDRENLKFDEQDILIVASLAMASDFAKIDDVRMTTGFDRTIEGFCTSIGFPMPKAETDLRAEGTPDATGPEEALLQVRPAVEQNLSRTLVNLEAQYAKRFGHGTPVDELRGLGSMSREQQAEAMTQALASGSPVPGWANKSNQQSDVVRPLERDSMTTNTKLSREARRKELEEILTRQLASQQPAEPLLGKQARLLQALQSSASNRAPAPPPAAKADVLNPTPARRINENRMNTRTAPMTDAEKAARLEFIKGYYGTAKPSKAQVYASFDRAAASAKRVAPAELAPVQSAPAKAHVQEQHLSIAKFAWSLAAFPVSAALFGWWGVAVCAVAYFILLPWLVKWMQR